MLFRLDLAFISRSKHLLIIQEIRNYNPPTPSLPAWDYGPLRVEPSAHAPAVCVSENVHNNWKWPFKISSQFRKEKKSRRVRRVEISTDKVPADQPSLRSDVPGWRRV